MMIAANIDLVNMRKTTIATYDDAQLFLAAPNPIKSLYRPQHARSYFGSGGSGSQ